MLKPQFCSRFVPPIRPRRIKTLDTNPKELKSKRDYAAYPNGRSEAAIYKNKK
jgi:hypothetical protein